MQPLYKILQNLTSKNPSQDFQNLTKDFAIQTGWNPSYFFASDTDLFANGHLVVEHGLENAAILTFLNKPFDELQFEERKQLLNLSYNNLVDWHIPIDKNSITFLFNRTQSDKQIVDEQRINIETYENLRIEAFQKVAGKKPSPNTPTLDTVLINTISSWKRKISSFMGNNVNNEALSSLFNTIIVLRAYEDNLRRHGKITDTQIMLSEFGKTRAENFSIVDIFKSTIERLNHKSVPDYLIDFATLDQFGVLLEQDAYSLCKDFYVNSVAAFYQYDFSIISKHALSKIYEKYVAVLDFDSSPQLTIWDKIPNEKINKNAGAYYTPQYLARFFSKYLKSQYSPTQFDKLKILEPAVGSGIFIRSLLELQIEDALDENKSAELNSVFSNIIAIDIDKNACHASKLSLALLYMLVNDTFPNKLDIINTDSIKYLNENPEYENYFDALISNPPFIRSDKKSTPERAERFSKYMEGDLSGKMDEYALFIKTAIKVLKPGGIALFVLPISFLINDSYKKLRKSLAAECTIKLIADLSLIPVFDTTGIYVMLLGFQKRSSNLDNEDALYLKASNNVGRALEDVLKGNFLETSSYSIYSIPQANFNSDYWYISSKKEQTLLQKINSFPSVNSFLEVKQGFVSGNDDVFIVDSVPKGERAIYKPFIPDKDIYAYLTNYKSRKFFFYPFINGEKISEKDLKKNFPITWSYLLKNKSALEKRVFENEWWFPNRPRTPENILQPKIITPHLVVMPRFGIDLKSDLTVSRSPFLTLKDDGANTDLLLYFLGVLNSSICFWYISVHSHKYGGNYNRLEKATLQHTKIPDPNSISRKDFLNLVRRVQERLLAGGQEAVNLEREIDILVAKLYGLTQEEMEALLIA